MQGLTGDANVVSESLKMSHAVARVIEVHQQLERKIMDAQLRHALTRNTLQQQIDCLMPNSYSTPAEAISRLRVDLFEANKKIKSLEETILRDRSCIWEKQNSLQAQIDSLMPGSDTLENNRELLELTETRNEVLKSTFEREKKSFVEELNRLTVKIEELSI